MSASASKCIFWHSACRGSDDEDREASGQKAKTGRLSTSGCLPVRKVSPGPLKPGRSARHRLFPHLSHSFRSPGITVLPREIAISTSKHILQSTRFTE